MSFRYRSKCAVCGMMVWLGFEMSNGMCIDSIRSHECHALEPHTHTETAIEPETPYWAVSTGVGSGSPVLTPFTGSLVLTGDACEVVVTG
jgi:hypothetical protein